MSWRMAAPCLAVLLCLWGFLLTVQAILHKPSAPGSIPDSPSAQRRVEVTKREPNVRPTKEATIEAAEPSEEVIPSRVKAGESDAIVAVDPDEEFMKRIASLPLDRANLETRREVERRLKAREKDRAKLLLSEKTDGKLVMAYAVKQPSMHEIAVMTKPYKMLLDYQTDLNAKQYVDQRYQNLFSSYGLTDGKYRLLYAIIPESPESGPIRRFSAAASSEQDCIEILQQRLAPKPPIQMGVPFSDGPGRSGTSYEILPGDWRMDHLVPQETLVPFYNSSRRSQLSNVDRPSTGK